jgi:hypothetical protein
MAHENEKLQKGTLRRVPRADGKWFWVWRYFDPVTRLIKSQYFRGEEFPTESAIKEHLVLCPINILHNDCAGGSLGYGDRASLTCSQVER